MPTTLLSLPRELRDEIYNLALAPTGIIMLTPTKENEHRRRSPPITIIPESPATRKQSASQSAKLRITLSLLRTCRQIHDECHEILFSNTFSFVPVDVEKVLHEMGQRQSRRIQKMMIDISSGFSISNRRLDWSSPDLRLHDNIPNDFFVSKFKSTRKLLRKSLSRARVGNLREISLKIQGVAMLPMAGLLRPSYYELLHCGHSMHGNWGKLGRSIEIWMNESEQQFFSKIAAESGHVEEELDNVLKTIHLVWEGKLLFNGNVMWNDKCRVAEIPVSKKSTPEAHAVALRQDKRL